MGQKAGSTVHSAVILHADHILLSLLFFYSTNKNWELPEGRKVLQMTLWTAQLFWKLTPIAMWSKIPALTPEPNFGLSLRDGDRPV